MSHKRFHLQLHTGMAYFFNISQPLPKISHLKYAPQVSSAIKLVELSP